MRDEAGRQKPEGRVPIWMVAIGTVIGSLSGVVAVITFIRDYDNPIARAILQETEVERANRREIRQSYEEFRNRDLSAWQAAVNSNTPEAYAAYADMFPVGHFVSEALARHRALHEQRAWDQALKRNDVEGFEAYLAAYPAGRHASAATLNRQRLQKEAGQAAFSAAALAGDARAAVLRARSVVAYALDAQRRAREGSPGYTSGHRDGDIIMFGIWEGRYDRKDGFLGIDYKEPVLGVWSPREVEAGPLGVRATRLAKLRMTRPTRDGYEFVGELTFMNNDVYQGEIRFLNNALLSFQMNGWGALWSEQGILIGSGRWKANQLRPES